MVNVNFITGIKADRRYGYSVYERNLYEGLKDKVNFNVISIGSLRLPFVGRTISRNFSLYFFYPFYVKLKVHKNDLNHIITQKDAFVLNFTGITQINGKLADHKDVL